MRTATKGQKAKAANVALVNLLNDPGPMTEVLEIAIQAGRMSAVAYYAGYLSTKQIDEEIEMCAGHLERFAPEYAKVLAHGPE